QIKCQRSILSDTNEEEINNAENNMQDEYLQNQNKIDNFLLDIDISLEFDDNNIATEEPLTDDQIIEMVLEENNSTSQNINNESDNEKTQKIPTVSIKEDSIFSTDMSFEITEIDILNSNYKMNENFEITEV
ncbi:8993_t:CDS:2, partial [Diversispora eburnea]